MRFIEDPRHLAGAETKGPPVQIGVDVGQRKDYTAIAVAECPKRDRSDLPGVQETFYGIRYLQRIPLGTSYPDVAGRVIEIVENLKARPLPPKRITVALDSTGVGRGLSDILQQPLRRQGVRLTNVTLVAGQRMTGKLGDREVSLGKEELVSRLQALFQTGRVEIPANNAEAAAMARELQEFEIKFTAAGNQQSGAFRTGAHDDLVVALALATMEAPRRGAMSF